MSSPREGDRALGHVAAVQLRRKRVVVQEQPPESDAEIENPFEAPRLEAVILQLAEVHQHEALTAGEERDGVGARARLNLGHEPRRRDAPLVVLNRVKRETVLLAIPLLHLCSPVHPFVVPVADAADASLQALLGAAKKLGHPLREPFDRGFRRCASEPTGFRQCDTGMYGD